MTQAIAGVTTDELVDRARQLGPRLRELHPETVRLGKLPVETMDTLRAAGLIQFFQPARYGGPELEWGAQIRVSREIAKACGSTAWITSVVGTHLALVGRFPEAAQDDVWGDGSDPLVSSASALTPGTGGTAARAPGGYTLKGVWKFASGIDHAAWAMLTAPLGEDESVHLHCLVPTSEITVVDDWDVTGLRGTGSKQIRIEEPVFIPEHRAMRSEEISGTNAPGAALNHGYVYRIDFRPYFGTIMLGPVLGAAEGALAEYITATSGRSGERGPEQGGRQLRLSEAAADIAFAGYAVDRMLDVLDRRGVAGEALTRQEWVESMRDRGYATMTCVNAVHRLLQDMGASGLSEKNRVLWHFRDLCAMASQRGLNWDRNGGAYGRWAFGLPTGRPGLDAPLTP